MSDPSTPVDAPRSERDSTARSVVIGIWLASALVLGAALATAFRIAPAQEIATLLRVQGPRVFFGAAAGALLAIAGALRQASGAERALRELEWLAFSVGAAAGGFGMTLALPALPALGAFAIGAAGGGGLLGAAARRLDRPQRATNLGVLALLALATFAAALAGTYARARRDVLPSIVTWLLGDLGGATLASGIALAAAAAILATLAMRAHLEPARARRLALLATAIGVGAAGPLAFVGGMVPRSVRWLAPRAATPAIVATSAIAGAATTAAIDAVPRLLVGGYDFPFNVPATLLAIPIYLGWNRMRLRNEVGRAAGWFEVLELVLIAAATLGATALAVQLTTVVRSAT